MSIVGFTKRQILLAKDFKEEMIIISERVLKHILNKHHDIHKILKIKDTKELRSIITNIIKKPDEAYINAFNVNYFLKKVNNLYLNVVVLNKEVKTAYLIVTYNRLARKKWAKRLY